VSYPLIILGGGLSGLAAGIRYARFSNKVLILEKHSKLGGLNSYYRRRGILFETGLHAITNYAPPGAKYAPLNRLFRQLKLPRRQFITHEQLTSEVVFPNHGTLTFSNDFSHFTDEIARLFPQSIDRFLSLVAVMDAFDPLSPRPWISAREQLSAALGDELLIDYLFCPLMFYGSSQEYDMDFSQFVILFRSIFQEGFFRPEGSIKDFLAMLRDHYSTKYLPPMRTVRIKSSVCDCDRARNSIATVYSRPSAGLKPLPCLKTPLRRQKRFQSLPAVSVSWNPYISCRRR